LRLYCFGIIINLQWFADVLLFTPLNCLSNLKHDLGAAVKQVPNIAPILGELAFFLGILQPMTARARPDGDVQLLVLSREDSNELFHNYPEQVFDPPLMGESNSFPPTNKTWSQKRKNCFGGTLLSSISPV
jgi:hypothetical protein